MLDFVSTQFNYILIVEPGTSRMNSAFLDVHSTSIDFVRIFLSACLPLISSPFFSSMFSCRFSGRLVGCSLELLFKLL